MPLGSYQQALNNWGLRENPFRLTPPDDFEELAKIFCGRDRELDIVLPTLFEGRNVLIQGKWGIGKTALIKTLLYRLQQEVSELGEEMLVIYISDLPSASIGDFYRSVLLAVTQQLSGNSAEAKKVADDLGGMVITHKNKLEGGVNFGIFAIKSTREANSVDLSDAELYRQLIFWIKQAEEIYGKVVIAVDDMDKKETPIVHQILESSLELFRQSKKRAFLMTGRGFTDLQDGTLRALGIFSESIELATMSDVELRKIALNYLNSERITASTEVLPFTEEVLAQIVDYAQGTPRQLTCICEKVLRQAAMKGYQQIDDEVWSVLRKDVQESLMQDLSPHLRRLLYVAYQEQGLNEDISNKTLDRLNVVTFAEILPQLIKLESMDLVIRSEDEQGFRFVPSKLYLPPDTVIVKATQRNN
jgi:Cdc6-like AAA superfamily ATPase